MLFVQGAVAAGKVQIKKVKGDRNPADILTKYVNKYVMNAGLKLLGMKVIVAAAIVKQVMGAGATKVQKASEVKDVIVMQNEKQENMAWKDQVYFVLVITGILITWQITKLLAKHGLKGCVALVQRCCYRKGDRLTPRVIVEEVLAKEIHWTKAGSRLDRKATCGTYARTASATARSSTPTVSAGTA